PGSRSTIPPGWLRRPLRAHEVSGLLQCVPSKHQWLSCSSARIIARLRNVSHKQPLFHARMRGASTLLAVPDTLSGMYPELQLRGLTRESPAVVLIKRIRGMADRPAFTIS